MKNRIPSLVGPYQQLARANGKNGLTLIKASGRWLVTLPEELE